MSYTADQQERSHHFVPLEKLTMFEYSFSTGRDILTMNYCHENYSTFVGVMHDELAGGKQLTAVDQLIGFLNTVLETGLQVKKNLLFDKEILPAMKSTYSENIDQISLNRQSAEIDRALSQMYLIEAGVTQEIVRLGNHV